MEKLYAGRSVGRSVGFGGPARYGFVSTNSIVQGEQVAQLWPILFERCGVEIAFAHRTFAWGSDARGKAHVHVVIIGLMHRDDAPREKRLFSYASASGDPDETRHAALTAYLFDAGSVANRHLVVREEARPINGARRLVIGSKPIDDGNFIFTSGEKNAFLTSEPKAEQFLRPFVGAEEFIQGTHRWILALHEADPAILNNLAEIKQRIAAVRRFRENSKSLPTRDLSRTPHRYHVNQLPERPYLLIPRVSSERRDYVPIGWLEPPVIPSDAALVLLDAGMFEFAILTSRVQMAWLSYIGGRLKSDYRYSIGLVYNTFPWPDTTAVQRDKIEALAQAVLDARAAWPTSSLADLYDPDTMPANLRRAHGALDLAVDRLYRREPFADDRDRVQHLFGRYEALVDPLGREGVKQNRRVARKVGKASKE